MATSSLCVVCRSVLVENSLSGLCQTCLRSATPRDPVPLAAERRPTRSFAGPPETLSGPPLPDPALASHRLPAGFVPLELLGQGGMGLVYKVWEKAADRVVALKLVRAVTGPELRARFGVEVKALAGLNHPNIVKVLAVDLSAQDPYFTMEFVDGRGLERRLADRGALPADEAAGLIETVARAVHAAHEAGVIHRDLKPSNILVGSDGVPKVTDFGVAKRDGLDDRLTMTGMVVGTPAFMAPEQASGRPVDGRADVYGLGATLFALLTRQAPFAAQDPADVLAQVRRDDPPLPRSLRPDVPPGLEAIVLKCLEKSPEARYKTAKALADELAAWRAGEAPEAPGVTWRARLARSARGRKRLRTAGAAVLGCAVLVTLLYAAGLFGSPVPKDPPDPKTEFLHRAQADLRAGKKVELVGATGLPAWHEAQLFPATLGPSPLGDQTCCFQTLSFTLLELLPDPGVDRYRISTELRHVSATRPPPPTLPSGLECIGLYFGAETQVMPSGRPVTTLLGIHYRDVGPKPIPGKEPDPSLVHFQPGAVLPVRGKRVGEYGPGMQWVSGAASLKFVPSPQYSGPWRCLEADVTPEGVTARWASEPGVPFTLIKCWSGDETRMLYAGLHRRIVDSDASAAPMPDPAWSPRMALGIYCRSSAVAVRNFVIEPLPQQP